MKGLILRPNSTLTFFVFLTALVIANLVLATSPLANPILQMIVHPQELVPGQGEIPGDGTTWHEVFGFYCTTLTQVTYDDRDGDQKISLNDRITLRWYGDDVHGVVWVGSVYLAVCTPPDGNPPYDVVFSRTGYPCSGPEQSQDLADPVGETWYELYPSSCQGMPVDEWIDHNMSGVVDAGDEIRHDDPEDGLGPFVYGISSVASSMGVISPPPIRVGTSTWSTLKATYDQ